MVTRFVNAGNVGASVWGWAEKIVSLDLNNKGANWESAVDAIFAVKDRVRHPKFGAGTVVDVTGHGKDARIRIAFDDKGEKELALAIAPIVRIEEET